MSLESQPESSALVAAFGEHLHAFYLGLPPEGRQLLERLVARAMTASTEPREEVHGYLLDQNLLFGSALITAIGLPALDASSKDAAKMTVKFSPEYTRSVGKTGGA